MFVISYHGFLSSLLFLAFCYSIESKMALKFLNSSRHIELSSSSRYFSLNLSHNTPHPSIHPSFRSSFTPKTN